MRSALQVPSVRPWCEGSLPFGCARSTRQMRSPRPSGMFSPSSDYVHSAHRMKSVNPPDMFTSPDGPSEAIQPVGYVHMARRVSSLCPVGYVHFHRR